MAAPNFQNLEPGLSTLLEAILEASRAVGVSAYDLGTVRVIPVSLQPNFLDLPCVWCVQTLSPPVGGFALCFQGGGWHFQRAGRQAALGRPPS